MAVLGFLLVAVLLMLSPMMWLRPSRAESVRGRLRRHAKGNGGELSFAKAPLAQPDLPLTGYRLRYPGTLTGSDFTLVRDRVGSDALAPAAAGWRWRQAPLPSLDTERLNALEAWLETLPEDALAVESHQHTLCVWWQEAVELARFEREWPSWQAMRDTLAGSGNPAPPPARPS
ncbi:preprotein translocase subunit YajC [Salinicola sp. JS01]|uniref:preprotein translocase subunit YajC n=1 Tax=Salinicola sp. JS01 TaxID=3050071 RepID=UPI00255B4411|nr:preprotein translocase subunit YajC [Salinicola sp. JS01]WIX34348.1 preprotein translocase subunit YajC [Salinicola sp. JS01]